MHRHPATRTVGVFWFDCHIHARQMSGERATIGATLLGTRTGSRCVLLVVIGLVCRNGLFDILKPEPQLIGIELLRTPAKLRALQLTQKMPKAVILRQRMVALGDRSVTFHPRRREQRLQRFNLLWELRWG